MSVNSTLNLYAGGYLNNLDLGEELFSSAKLDAKINNGNTYHVDTTNYKAKLLGKLNTRITNKREATLCQK